MTMKVTGRGLEFRDSDGRVRTAVIQETDGSTVVVSYDTSGDETGRTLLGGAEDVDIGDDLSVAGDLAVEGVTEVDRFRLGSRGASLVAGDFALSAGWGTDAAISVTPNSKEQSWRVTVTAGTASVGANPTITLTFPGGAYPYAPRCLMLRNGGSGGTLNPSWSGQPSTTALVITAAGTPTVNLTYSYECLML
jgi:hypothetical protein